MRIVVNHLTRMRQRFICVAGIDPDSCQHVRPVAPFSGLTSALLARRGGAFDIASIVDLGATTHDGCPPEVEDHRFNPRRARCVGQETAPEFWTRIELSSHDTLNDIFGDDLKPQGRNCALDPGKGRASLGCLRLSQLAELSVSAWGRVRIDFTDGRHTVSSPVTDVRLYATDLETPQPDIVRRVARHLESGEGVILSVGLGRAWQRDGDTTPRHWLQVNNIHLESDPVWNGPARLAR